MRDIIGTKNAGFEIIRAQPYNGTGGYCLGKKEDEFVTWYYTKGSNGWDFCHGHYFTVDHDAPLRSFATACADYHRRLMDAYERIAEYGL